LTWLSFLGKTLMIILGTILLIGSSRPPRPKSTQTRHRLSDSLAWLGILSAVVRTGTDGSTRQPFGIAHPDPGRAPQY